MFLLVFFGENISSQFCQRHSDVGLLAVPQRRTRDNERPPFQPSKNQFRFHKRSSSSNFSYLDLLSAFKIKFQFVVSILKSIIGHFFPEEIKQNETEA